MSLNVLFLGEIVGRAGIATIKTGLKALKEKYDIDYTVANAEGTTNGFGIGAAHAVQLSKLGINLLTGGEKFYYKVDFVEFLPKCNFALRPANYGQGSPGKAYKIITIKDKKIGITNFISSSGFSRISANNPFLSSDYMLKKLEEETDIILVQFHCATTAEAASFAHYLDGRVAAVISTHNKVLTADARILPGGTAFISDNGRCGSFLSVGGLDPRIEIEKFLTAVPQRSWEAWDGGELQGVVVKIDEESNKATEIIPFREEVKVTRPPKVEAGSEKRS